MVKRHVRFSHNASCIALCVGFVAVVLTPCFNIILAEKGGKGGGGGVSIMSTYRMLPERLFLAVRVTQQRQGVFPAVIATPQMGDLFLAVRPTPQRREERSVSGCNSDTTEERSVSGC